MLPSVWGGLAEQVRSLLLGIGQVWYANFRTDYVRLVVYRGTAGVGSPTAL